MPEKIASPKKLSDKNTKQEMLEAYQTLAKQLLLWDDEKALPGRGDLVLIDEASTATTLDVRDVVRVAEEHGALVRLIGDPRQAKACYLGPCYLGPCCLGPWHPWLR